MPGSWPGDAPPRRQRLRRLVVVLQPREEVAGVAEEDAVEEGGGLEPGVNGGVDLRSTSRPTLLEFAVQGGKVGADNRAGEVLGQKISRVGSPTDLEEREMTSTQPLLDPQLSHR